jgi:hypothetical protein
VGAATERTALVPDGPTDARADLGGGSGGDFWRGTGSDIVSAHWVGARAAKGNGL